MGNEKHSELYNVLRRLKGEYKILEFNIIKNKKTIEESYQLRTFDEYKFNEFELNHNRALINEIAKKIKDIKKEIKYWQREYAHTGVKKMKGEQFKTRMYSLVLRQLSPMQKGVQALHSVVEYSNNISNATKDSINEYKQWSLHDKTIIILEGGTSPEMDENINKLNSFGIHYSTFTEPDLYGLTTAISFIADERVWKTKEYPDYDEYTDKKLAEIRPVIEAKARNLVLTTFIPDTMEEWAEEVFNTNLESAEKLMELRKFIFSMKLAQ